MPKNPKRLTLQVPTEDTPLSSAALQAADLPKTDVPSTPHNDKEGNFQYPEVEELGRLFDTMEVDDAMPVEQSSKTPGDDFRNPNEQTFSSPSSSSAASGSSSSRHGSKGGTPSLKGGIKKNPKPINESTSQLIASRLPGGGQCSPPVRFSTGPSSGSGRANTNNTNRFQNDFKNNII